MPGRPPEAPGGPGTLSRSTSLLRRLFSLSKALRLPVSSSFLIFRKPRSPPAPARLIRTETASPTREVNIRMAPETEPFRLRDFRRFSSRRLSHSSA